MSMKKLMKRSFGYKKNDNFKKRPDDDLYAYMYTYWKNKN